jgi:prepilin peptidase CpaA
MGMFAVGWVGGGDAKLFAATLLWPRLGRALRICRHRVSLGGVLTLGLIMLRRNPLPPMLAKLPWFLRLADRASACLTVLRSRSPRFTCWPDTDVFQLAAIS